MWKLTIDTNPVKTGYYFVEYYNSHHKDWYYKSIWYNSKEDQWQGPWAWSYDKVPYTDIDGKEFYRIVHKGLDVKRYVLETHDLHYGPSMMKYEELLQDRNVGQPDNR